MHVAAQNLNAAPARESVVAVPLWRDVRVLNVLLLAGAVAMFAAYLGLNNRAAQKGFEVRTLERQIMSLQDEREKLNLSVVQEQSMGALEGRVAGLGLVPVGSVQFVSGDGGAVAVR